MDGLALAVGFFPMPSLNSATGIKVAIRTIAMMVGFENSGKKVIAESLSAHTELSEVPVIGESMRLLSGC